jgi:hypothetical protein
MTDTERWLINEARRLRAEAMEHHAANRIGMWWRISGYADVLARAVGDLALHRRRADGCYSEVPQTTTEVSLQSAGSNAAAQAERGEDRGGQQ